MLQNAHLLAKFGFDTAENEPAKKFANFRSAAAERPPDFLEGGFELLDLAGR